MNNSSGTPYKPVDENKAQKSSNALLGFFITLGLISTLLFLYWLSTGTVSPTGFAQPFAESSLVPAINSTLTSANSGQPQQAASDTPDIEPSNTPEPLNTPTPEEPKLPGTWLPALETANACAAELSMPVKIQDYKMLWQWLPEAIRKIQNIPSNQIPVNCQALSNTYGHHGLNELLARAGGSNWWAGQGFDIQDCDSIKACANQCSNEIGYTQGAETFNAQLLLNAYLAEVFPGQSSGSESCVTFQYLLIREDFPVAEDQPFPLAQTCGSRLLPQSMCTPTYISNYSENCAVFLEVAPNNVDLLESIALERYATTYGDLPNECLEFLREQFSIDRITTRTENDIQQSARCIQSSECPSNSPNIAPSELIYACVTEIGWSSDIEDLNLQQAQFTETLLAAPWLDTPLPESCISAIDQQGIQTSYWSFITTLSQAP